MRNALAKTPKRLREAFRALALEVMYASSEEAATKSFSELEKAMGRDAQRAVACLAKDLEALLVHYRFEQRFWKALKTTNAIERLNKELKRRTKSMETVGESTLTTVVAFTALRLEVGWQMHPVDSPVLDNLPRLFAPRPPRANAVEHAIAELEGSVQ
jgi:transposase-like protein